MADLLDSDTTLTDIYAETLPWVLDHTITDEQNNSAIVDAHRVVVAFMSDDGLHEDVADDIIDARGRLMAAAPEMYRVVQGLIKEGVVVSDELRRLMIIALNKAQGVDGDDD